MNEAKGRSQGRSVPDQPEQPERPYRLADRRLSRPLLGTNDVRVRCESGIVLIAGPTASGKSALALDLAEVLGGTIINADSMQVYRELRILTARPGADEEARVPHKLYGVLSAAEPCSAALWRDLALDAIADARAEGRLPILVGGTGLYFRALLDGLAPVPEIPEAIRREIARSRPPRTARTAS